MYQETLKVSIRRLFQDPVKWPKNMSPVFKVIFFNQAVDMNGFAMISIESDVLFLGFSARSPDKRSEKTSRMASSSKSPVCEEFSKW